MARHYGWTENERKNHQRSKNKLERPPESLQNYCSRPLINLQEGLALWKQNIKTRQGDRYFCTVLQVFVNELTLVMNLYAVFFIYLFQVKSFNISFICWFSVLSIKDMNSVSSIVNTCFKVTGAKQRHLCSLFGKSDNEAGNKNY